MRLYWFTITNHTSEFQSLQYLGLNQHFLVEDFVNSRRDIWTLFYVWRRANTWWVAIFLFVEDRLWLRHRLVFNCPSNEGTWFVNRDSFCDQRIPRWKIFGFTLSLSHPGKPTSFEGMLSSE